jgi:hypothetical protein
VFRGLQAIASERRYMRWFDYLSLALGVAPFVALAIVRLF